MTREFRVLIAVVAALGACSETAGGDAVDADAAGADGADLGLCCDADADGADGADGGLAPDADVVGCVAPRPYPYAGKCVECVSHSQCESGLCLGATQTCQPVNLCGTCGGSYAACTELGGENYCVPCTDDAHCSPGCRCDLATFTCEGPCSGGGPPCKTDADCDPGETGFELTCEVASGLCVDAAGRCDEITAHCLGGGVCVNLVKYAGTRGLPTPPVGGKTFPGACACGPGAVGRAAIDGRVCGAGSCFALSGVVAGAPDICVP
ncbi:MAG: hypothetical protein R3F39_16960 [Myxococcota bacterium]